MFESVNEIKKTKRKGDFQIKKLLSLTMLVSLSLSSLCFAESPNHIPDKMLPGSVIVYDEQLNPILEKGGYDCSEDVCMVSYEKLFQKRISITSDMSEDEKNLLSGRILFVKKRQKT